MTWHSVYNLFYTIPMYQSTVFWGPFRRWQAINSAFSVAKKPDVTLLSALWHVAGRDVVPARTAVQPWSTVVLPCPRGVS
jgi:hypothetical protein